MLRVVYCICRTGKCITLLRKIYASCNAWHRFEINFRRKSNISGTGETEYIDSTLTGTREIRLEKIGGSSYSRNNNSNSNNNNNNNDNDDDNNK